MTAFSDLSHTAEAIFRHAVHAVQPAPLIRKNVHVEGNVLHIAGREYDLAEIERLFVIGAGKATAPMAQALEALLTDRITDGVIIVKHGHTAPLQRIRIVEAAHPVPDERGIAGTRQILQLIKTATAKDLVICLLSGGGSALLIDTPRGCSLEELQLFFRLLLESGADIAEMNTVRKHLSAVKGGLTRAVYPAPLVSLILSDVTGDPLDVIASGPTVPDPTTFADALSVLRKYGLEEKAPATVREYLHGGWHNQVPETPKPGDPVFAGTTNCIIGSNALALQAAQEKARQLGFHTRIVTDRIAGEAREVARQIVTEASLLSGDDTVAKPACLLWGGETTVTISGAGGLGGRNQELALAAAIELEGQTGTVVLSGGTDGTDGPTDAAGAVVDGLTSAKARAKNLDPQSFLSNHDSYHFFRQAGGHIHTGPTLTNVMDLIIVLVL
jgi:hydroxypyruvate reductase